MGTTFVIREGESPDLVHHGIKGQKWGIRRFQNADGTLTPAGRKHYYNSDGTSTKYDIEERRQLNKELNKIGMTDAMLKLHGKEISKAIKDSQDEVSELVKKHAESLRKSPRAIEAITEQLNLTLQSRLNEMTKDHSIETKNGKRAIEWIVSGGGPNEKLDFSVVAGKYK